MDDNNKKFPPARIEMDMSNYDLSADGTEWVMKPEYAKAYLASCDEQLECWVHGQSLHNSFANECCPDFSCCEPSLQWDAESRKAFQRASPGDRTQMLLSGLVRATSGDIHVAGTAPPSQEQH